MKYTIHATARYKKDLKRIAKQGVNLNLLKEVITTIASGQQLDIKYRDHILSGDHVGRRECHLTPDWLLIYELDDDMLILILTRTGSHSDLFK